MITWMQKHKKYLVVTIWVSTIAFVGAGFVGWGAYDLNSNRATSVAKVGNRNISVQEFQQTYGDLYNYYASLSEGKFSTEQAEEMGLDKIALDKIIRENLFLNYADELGLDANNQDIIAYLMNDKSFQVDGKFDKNRYEETLRRARITPKDYENALKNKILLDKIFNALNLKATTSDLEMLSSSYFMKDRVALQIVKASSNDIVIDENELKKLWEKDKNKYLTKTEYFLDTKYISKLNLDVNNTVLMAFFEDNRGNYRDSADKLLSFEEALESVKRDYILKNSRKFALEEYLKIKKGESNATEPMKIFEDAQNFPINELAKAQIGEVLKPFEYKDGFLIIKLQKVARPEVMSYENARSEVLKTYEEIKIREKLEERAKKALENFNGKDIGFITRDSRKSVDGLSETEFLSFVMKLFESQNKKGYVVLDGKAVVYNILEQELLNSDKLKEYNSLLVQNIGAIKNAQLQQDLLDTLQKRYDVELYYRR
ncbi:peptidylprolyl isomerase [Campylobacter hyointestinalis]|uniref:peptidylprolyl isomerase n=1 Tax=Campylobacter hyointestinalis TaxID=198 RepID=UPI000DCCFFF2|nr:peptidylprolyl isomerase [Campylobacter hyointestinalis]RAZ61230.1 peptidylprolyl isomerase [Campylobacter hyointestinalis subsp. lawsonii]